MTSQQTYENNAHKFRKQLEKNYHIGTLCVYKVT